MTNIDRLAEIVGSKAKLAEICSVDPAMVTRWSKDGRLPTKYNRAVMEWLAKHSPLAGNPEGLTDFARIVLDPHRCPTCGQPVDDGAVL